LDQFCDRIVVGQKIVRATESIQYGRVFDIDAHAVVEGGEDLLEVNRARGRLFTEAVGGADDLSRSHAAAGQQGAGDTRPVIASAVLVDARRPSELAPDDNGYILVQSAIIDV